MLQARRGGAGGADILVCKIFLRSTVASMETYSTLCVSLCMCVCVCVAALMQYVKATRSIYSKYNNNNKSDNDSSNNNNDKYTKHEYWIRNTYSDNRAAAAKKSTKTTCSETLATRISRIYLVQREWAREQGSGVCERERVHEIDNRLPVQGMERREPERANAGRA